jgi:hypothetical protein
MTFSKAEAAAMLHISDSTFTRRLKAGRYIGTRDGEGQFAPLTFTFAGLGLVEPTPAVAAVEAQPPAVEAKPEPIPDISTPDAFNPTEFRDSFGHRIAGNAKHVLFDNQPPPRPVSTDDHMPDGLKNKPTIGVYDAGSDNHPINQMMIRAGLMKADTRPMTETQRRQFVNAAAWRAGMAKGFSR